MCHFDGTNGQLTTVDNSSNAFAISPWNFPALSNTQVKFGTTSTIFPSATDGWTVPGESVFVPTGDFTFDFWTYLDTSTATQIWFQKRVGTNGFTPYILAWGTSVPGLYFSASSGPAGETICNASVSGGVISSGVMTHLAVVRNSSIFTVYVNGIGTVVAVSTADLYNSTSDLFFIGDPNTGPGLSPLAGFADEFRFSNVARWTANFTPPTQPYSTTSGSSGTTTYFASITYPSFQRSFRPLPG
jgi:hypothetical protein